jgi:hypothetical protein
MSTCFEPRSGASFLTSLPQVLVFCQGGRAPFGLNLVLQGAAMLARSPILMRTDPLVTEACRYCLLVSNMVCAALPYGRGPLQSIALDGRVAIRNNVKSLQGTFAA